MAGGSLRKLLAGWLLLSEACLCRAGRLLQQSRTGVAAPTSSPASPPPPPPPTESPSSSSPNLAVIGGIASGAVLLLVAALVLVVMLVRKRRLMRREQYWESPRAGERSPGFEKDRSGPLWQPIDRSLDTINSGEIWRPEQQRTSIETIREETEHPEREVS